MPGAGVGEDGAEGVDVALLGQVLAVELLRRHDVQGADDSVVPGQGGVGVRDLGDAEVDDARAVVGHDDVARLEVAMDDPALVDGGQALGQRRPERTDAGFAERPAPVDGGGQGRTRNISRGHPGRFGVRVRGHDRGGVEPPDRAGGGHLVAEPEPEVRVVGMPGVDDLDRHLSVTRRDAQVDPAHAAFAEPAQQPEPANVTGVTGSQRIQPLQPSNKARRTF